MEKLKWLETCEMMRRVNDFWISRNPEPGEATAYTNAKLPYVPKNGWDISVYFMGCLAAYRVTQQQEYLDYALRWAEKYRWRTFQDPDGTTKNADSQACGSVYCDLYRLRPDGAEIKPILDNIAHSLDDEKADYWSWVDAVFMGAPLYGRLYDMTGEERYLEKLHALYRNTLAERDLFDCESGLWYRDERLKYPAYQSVTGQKEFWGRGNGWIFAATAQILQYIEPKDPTRPVYQKIFMRMAESLRRIQGEDGCWRASLLEPEAFPAPETSGTALITYGLMLGVNLGELDLSFAQTAERAWQGMIQLALTEDGRVGYAQPGGDRPAAASFEMTNDFTTGAFLLAGEQMADYYGGGQEVLV